MGYMTQLTVTPHPVLIDGQRSERWELLPGESLYAFLQRHVENLDGQPWAVTVGNREVKRHLWHHDKPKNGQVIEVRGGLGENALYYVAMAVLIYFTAGAGATWAAGLGTLGASVAYAATFVVGSMLINKVLGPKAPTASGTQSKDSVYNIGAARNALRPYDPFALTFGEVRSTPDYLSQPYTYYIGSQQYVAMIFTPGLNCQSIGDLYNGDALLSSFDGVTTWYNGFPGMTDQDIPLLSNVDTIDGGELSATQAWVQRTTSAETLGVQINLEYALGGTGTSGKDYLVSETVEVQSRLVGASAWDNLILRTFTSSDQTTIRRVTLSEDLDRGQYDVRVRIRGEGNYSGSNQQTNKFNWTTLGSVQADDADYTGIPRIGVRIKATGQLNGYPDEIRGVVKAEPIPVWNGSDWVTATDRGSGLSNPGAQLLKYARGHYIQTPEGPLRYAGLGLTDDMIDIEALKGFMLHCTANSYTYDYIVKDAKSHDEVCNTIALAGMGQISWAGGKFSVVWAGADQPVSGVVNMATIMASSFKVDYSLVAGADGVEYTYFDRDTWSSQTIYVNAPGVLTALNPAKVSGEGITTAAHAAIMARYHLGQSLYQFKSIGYDTDLEHMTYRRMSVLALQHDMTQWGYGGRLKGASTSAGLTTLHLDEPVPAPAAGNAYIGVRVPGERVYRVIKVRNFSGTTQDIVLDESWPSDAPLPGNGNPADDHIWIYDFKQTPGYRVRVTGIEPQSDLKGASISVVPESDEFWDYVINGTYRKPDNQSLLQTKPTASNLAVTESQVVQGDTVFTQLAATFDVSGPVGVTRVYSDIGGNGELEQVAETTGRTARWRIPGAGTYAVLVRPFNLDGEAGNAVSGTYTTTGTDGAPVNIDSFTIDELSGGIRRYSWAFDTDTIQSPDFTGVQIRYTEGSEGAPSWSAMTPLGNDTGYHATAFESTLPASGSWTFAVRAMNTSGTLSNTMLTVQRVLANNLGEELVGVTQQLTDSQLKLTAVIEDIDQHSSSIVAQALAQNDTNESGRASRAYIARVDKVKVDAEGASAIAQQIVSAEVGPLRAAVDETSEAVANIDGSLSAGWSVRAQVTVDGKAYLSGISVGATADGDVIQTQFYIPFQVVEGVVYMNNAMIRDASITNAKIGAYIQSSNYEWDVASDTYTGWQINKDGSARFGGDVEIRGLLTTSLLESSALALGSTRIHTGGGRLAPFTIQDVSFASINGSAWQDFTQTVSGFVGPASGSGFHGKRFAAQRTDVFIDVFCAGARNSETIILEVQYDSGSWQQIQTVNMDVSNKAMIPLQVRYTTADTWNTVAFRARTTQGNTQALSIKVNVQNYNESANPAGQNSGTTGSGSGGGVTPVDPTPWCVDYETTVLPDGRFVRDLQVGELVECVDVRTGVRTWQALLAMGVGFEDCYVVSTAHAEVIQSSSTPMDMRDGSIVRTPDLAGHELLTHAHDWEVADIRVVGRRKVCKPDFGNRMFFAGTAVDRTLATHNIQYKSAE
jgi:hypothetical protein